MISPKVFWISEKKLVTESYFSEESCNNIKQKYVRPDIFFVDFTLFLEDLKHQQNKCNRDNYVSQNWT